MTEDKKEAEEGKESEWNEAQLKTKRLSDLQNLANIYQMNSDFKGWYLALCSLYKEVYGKLSSEEIADCIKKMNSIQGFFNKQNSHKYNLYGLNIKSVSSLLFEYDCKLRKLLELHGYGTKNVEDKAIWE